MDVISVNGVVTPASEARISPLDRGFLYGDSVYETIRTYNGLPFRLDAHLDRLRRSAGAIGIDPARTPVDPRTAVQEAIGRGGFDESAIRVILSRGEGAIGYDDAACGPPTLVVHVRACPPIPEAWRREGVDVAVVAVRRNAAAALDPAIKSSNLLNNLLAWRAGRSLGVYEPILLDADGNLTEGASSNLFLVREGTLLTPALEIGILRGITRDAVLDLARAHDLTAQEAVLPAPALAGADEAFLTSTLKGVLPIRRVDGWPVREGRPGPVTRRLAALYEELAQEETKTGAVPGAMRR